MNPFGSDDSGSTLVAAVSAPVSVVRRTVASDDVLQHGGIMSAAMLASGALNYGYQVFMGRALGPKQYGVFGAVFALVYLVNVLGRGIRFSATRFAAEFASENRSVASFHAGFLARAALFAAVVFVAVLLTAPVTVAFLGLGSSLPVVIVAANGLFGLALTANQGVFQGLQRFGALGTYQVLLAALKLVVGVALVYAGYGVAGALGAVALASFLVLVATTLHLRSSTGDRTGPATAFEYGRAYRYLPPAVLAGFCITVPGTVDVLVVKHFFSAADAGLYAAAAVLGKILVFLPMGISTALFPKVSNDRASGESARRQRLFDRAVLYVGLLVGVGTLVLWVVPDLTVALVFGPAYAGAVPLVRWYGVAVLFVALAIVVLNFQLALDRTGFVYVFTAASVVEILLLWVAHSSMVEVIQVILLVNGGLFAYGFISVKS